MGSDSNPKKSNKKDVVEDDPEEDREAEDDSANEDESEEEEEVDQEPTVNPPRSETSKPTTVPMITKQKNMPPKPPVPRKSVYPSIPPDIPQDTPDGTGMSTLSICLITLVVYIAVMTIAGGTVYVAYNGGWGRPGPIETTDSADDNEAVIIEAATDFDNEFVGAQTEHYDPRFTSSIAPQTTTLLPQVWNPRPEAPTIDEIKDPIPTVATVTSTSNPPQINPPAGPTQSTTVTSPTNQNTLQPSTTTATAILSPTTTAAGQTTIFGSTSTIPSTGPGGSATTTTATIPITTTLTTTTTSSTRAPATAITQLGTAITQCPTIYAACPEVSGCRPVSCVPQPTTCVPRSTTPCAPMASCPNGQCRPPCTAPTRQPDPPFSEFETNRAGRWQSKSVAEWINMFAPYSRERLNVVITLLDETVEKWAYAGFAHRCAPSSVKSPYLIHNTKCTFCNDRYSYIKCVMSGEVAGPINPYGQTHLFFDDNALRNARHNIPYILWNSVSQVINLVTHFVNIEKAIQPFQVKRADGIECRVCADFNRKVYDRCISHDRVYEGP